MGVLEHGKTGSHQPIDCLTNTLAWMVFDQFGDNLVRRPGSV
jgi:hypothetical protein